MLFDREEKLVSERFLETFSAKTDILNEELVLLSKVLENSRAKPEEFNKYSLIMLAGLNLKGSLGAYDRLSKGYISDSETLFKRVIESLLAQIHLDNTPSDALKWCQNQISLGSLNKNRYELAKMLDQTNKQQQFFKTDMANFFVEEIYNVGYKNACSVAHMDFERVHDEMGLESGDASKYAHTLILGPNFNKSFMEITLNRLVMFTLFQLTYLADSVGYTDKEAVTNVFKKVMSLFSYE